MLRFNGRDWSIELFPEHWANHRVANKDELHKLPGFIKMCDIAQNFLSRMRRNATILKYNCNYLSNYFYYQKFTPI